VTPAGPGSDHTYGAGARTAAYGIAFNLGSYLLTRGLNLVITVALARILAPEGMGLIAAALLALELIDMVHGFGLRETLIYDREGDRRRQSAAFVIVCVIAILQMLAMLLVSPWSANFVEDPLIVPIMMWLSLLFPITSLGTVHEAILLRSLEFRKTAGAEVFSIIAKASISLGLLYLGYGVWSFVAGMFAGQTVRTIAFWLLCDWRPKSPDLRWSTILDLLRYGQHIVLTGFIGLLRKRSDQLSIVTAMGDASLGIYFVASRIPDIAILGVSVTFSKIVFPTFANASDDHERLIGMYLKTIYGSMLMMAPIAFGIMCVAPMIVPLLFGEGWSDAIPVLVVLAFSGIPQTIGWTAGDVFKARGRPELLSYINVAQTAVTAPVVFLLALTTRDLFAISLGILAGEFAGAFMRLWTMKRYEGVPVLATLAAGLKPILAAGLMATVVLAAQGSLSTLGAGLQLAIAILIGMISYPMILMLIDRKNSIYWLRLLKPRKT
jgi:PST family polysaccharide transporter